MDLRKYNSSFVTADDVRDGPRQEEIIHVYEGGKFGRPVLEFASGDQFNVNVTNTRILMKAYGFDSADLIGQVIQLELGHYKDWNTDPPEQKETVVLRPISERKPSADNGGAKAALPSPRQPPPKADLDDEIPF